MNEAEGYGEENQVNNDWEESEKEQGMDDDARALDDSEDEEEESRTWAEVTRGYKEAKKGDGTRGATACRNMYETFQDDQDEYDSADELIEIEVDTPNGIVKQLTPLEKPPGLKRIAHSKPNTAKAIQYVSKCIGNLSMLEDEEYEERVASMEDKWAWEETQAVGDSGSVDTVVNPKRLPGHKIIETEDARNGAHWTCAGETKIPKLGMIKLSWQTTDGVKQRTEVMVGEVGKTLISTHRLDEAGFDTYLTKNNPRITNRSTGETIKLVKKGRLHYLSMWVRVKKGGLVANVNKAQNTQASKPEVSNGSQVRVFRRLAPVKACMANP